MKGHSSKIVDLLEIIVFKMHKRFIIRSDNKLHMPGVRKSNGGKVFYVEWAHGIGIFQTLIHTSLPKKASNQILDIGCGTCLMEIAESK